MKPFLASFRLFLSPLPPTRLYSLLLAILIGLFAGSLAYPDQTALVPAAPSGSGISSPGISASSGDLTAGANGNVFTISSLPSGEAMMSGTLPYPISGVSIAGDTVHFTMPESNSVVMVPLKF